MTMKRILTNIAPLAVLAVAACSPVGPEVRPVLSATGAEFARDPDTAYAAGVEHLRAGRFGSAVAPLQSALLARPDDLDALNALAAAFDMMGRFDLSDHYYHRALDAAPEATATLNNYGYSLYRRGQFKKAVIFLERARNTAPDDPVVAANLARLPSGGGDSTPRTKEPPPPAAPAAPVRLAAWVERTSPGVQTLVVGRTEAAEAAREAGVRPELAGLAGRLESPPAGGTVAAAVTGHGVALAPARIEVSNGAGRSDMARRMRSFLNRHGIAAHSLTNDKPFGHARSVVFYREGFSATARAIAALLPIPVETKPAPGQTSDVRLRLGRDLLEFDDTLLPRKGVKHER